MQNPTTALYSVQKGFLKVMSTLHLEEITLKDTTLKLNKIKIRDVDRVFLGPFIILVYLLIRPANSSINTKNFKIYIELRRKWRSLNTQ